MAGRNKPLSCLSSCALTGSPLRLSSTNCFARNRHTWAPAKLPNIVPSHASTTDTMSCSICTSIAKRLRLCATFYTLLVRVLDFLANDSVTVFESNQDSSLLGGTYDGECTGWVTLCARINLNGRLVSCTNSGTRSPCAHDERV